MPTWVEVELRRVGLDRQEQDRQERLRRAAYQPPSIQGGADTSATARRAARFAHGALTRECQAIAAMPAETGRNNALSVAAYKIGGLLHYGLNEDAATTELVNAAITAGLAESAATKTVRSGLAAGQRKPRNFRGAA